jgi:FAD/FMN-containing dehydrogenase/Fe-S oxidoreductase
MHKSQLSNSNQAAGDLARDLRARIAGEVRFDNGSRALYATDGSNYRQPPIGVVVPRTIDDIIEAVRLARNYGVPILGRGCGTSLAGQCCNTALIIDTSKHLNRVLEIDSQRRIARVEPGTILDDLRAAAEPYGLTFGPDPATHTHCTIGGMIGNNSCGIHSVMAEFYGPGPRTEDNVVELDVLTYDGARLMLGPSRREQRGDIIDFGGRRAELHTRLAELGRRHSAEIAARFPKIPRRVSGYNLPQLIPDGEFNLAKALVGTESTCALTLEATVQLIPRAKARALAVLGYPSVYDAGEHVSRVREHKPIGLEGLDDVLIRYIKKKHLLPEYARLLPEGSGWLLVEFGGATRQEAQDRAREAVEDVKRGDKSLRAALYDDPEQIEKLWEIRESGLGATAFIPHEPDTWPGWEDSAVPPDKIGDYLRDFRKLLERHDYHCSLYGHFGQGCVHTRIDFDLKSAEGVKKFRRFTAEAAELVVDRYGGSISGEHGDGQARGDLLQVMFGDELMQAFREFKSVWDPEWKMNPGKVIDAEPRDRNLRLGPGHRPARPATHFSYPDDGHNFAHASLRCVGVGKCRRLDGGTMCPSFMVTREEKHTTRGRAHMLFEMLKGDVIHDGWKSDEVKEALDLCLSCKGCKGDCPVNVDIATYKAEFLSHYYDGRLRPRSAYAFGLIHRWARLAAWMPELANFFTQTPVISAVAKFLAGMAPQRAIPQFAPHTFRQRFAKRSARQNGNPEVILWPDTFNNHFYPEVCEAAVEVLEGAGYRVRIPQAVLCCGRPLYDYGMLDTAKAVLKKTMRSLGSEIEQGTPIIVLEPSCASVFRDELTNLFPEDPSAKRLKQQTYLLTEFLDEKGSGIVPNELDSKALLHGHCHQKALMGMEHEHSVLSNLGLELAAPDSGCCGMAGSFGFEQGERYEVAQRCGERVLLPSVRRAGDDTLIIADGFSCREQIRQGTGREALHSAQVLQMALPRNNAPIARPAERPWLDLRAAEYTTARRKSALWLTAALIPLSWAAARKLFARRTA